MEGGIVGIVRNHRMARGGGAGCDEDIGAAEAERDERDGHVCDVMKSRNRVKISFSISLYYSSMTRERKSPVRMNRSVELDVLDASKQRNRREVPRSIAAAMKMHFHFVGRLAAALYMGLRTSSTAENRRRRAPLTAGRRLRRRRPLQGGRILAEKADRSSPAAH